MAEIVSFVPKAEFSAHANVRDFVEICRSRLSVFGRSLSFQDDVWDVTEFVVRKGHGGKRERITFSNAAAVGATSPVMMQEPFLSFAKAYVRYMQGLRPTKAIHNRVSALRAIEAALSENGEVPDPVRVDSRILNRAAQIVIDKYSSGAAYMVGQQLELTATFMAQNRLTTVPVRWRNPIKRPASGIRVGEQFDERRQSRMPSLAALEALPKVFGLATQPADVITASVAALLLAAPDRIGEVLYLPEACEVREPRYGKEDAYGLRWWPAKGADPMVKWVVPSMASVVQEALRKIRAVTEEARRVAKWYEENQGQIYLAPNIGHLRRRTWLSTAEVADVIGLSSPGAANNWCKAHRVTISRRPGCGRRTYVRFAEVEAAVTAQLPRGFPVVDEVTGLKYSEALFVVRRHELNAQRATHRCIIEPVSIGQINTGLGSRAIYGHESIFTRMGFTEDDGSPIKITSHQFRHYLNTLAQLGGLSQLDIAKWSGRQDVRQNEVYDHVTPRQMVEKIRAALGGDEMFGPLAELPKKVMIRRDEFARLIVPTAHTTDLGYCIHDYTSSPCQLHMDCINCQELICVKGDEERAAMLRQRLEETRHLLAKAEAAAGDGYEGANRWVTHQRSTLERLEQLCAIMDDASVPVGAVIQLAAPNSASRMSQEVGSQLPRLVTRKAVRRSIDAVRNETVE